MVDVTRLSDYSVLWHILLGILALTNCKEEQIVCCKLRKVFGVFSKLELIISRLPILKRRRQPSRDV